MGTWAATSILFLLLTGCLAPVHPDQAADDSTRLVRTVVAVPDCPSDCHEPTVAVAPDGTIYVGDGGRRVYRANHLNDAFVQVTAPPQLVGVDRSTICTGPVNRPGCPPDYSFDQTVHVGPDGRLYFTSIHGSVVAHGIIHIRASNNRGETWTTSTIVEASGEGHTLTADRQWLTFGKAGELYLTFSLNQCPANQQPLPGGQLCRAELMVTRSDDGAKTFGPVRAVTPLPEWLGLGAAGQPAILLDGKLAIPFANVAMGPKRPARELFVAISDDKAESFAIHRVTTAGVNVATLLPSAASGPAGELYVVHGAYGDQTGTFLQASRDGGATWSSLQVTNASMDYGTSPWVLADANGAHVLFYEDDGGTASVWLGTVQGNAVSKHRLAANLTGCCGFNEANTHFAHMSWTPEGKLLAMWSSATEDSIWVAEIDANAQAMP